MIKAETVSSTYYEDPERFLAVQFREPVHFRKLFKGKMAYLLGAENPATYKGTALFHIKPESAVNTIGVQVELVRFCSVCLEWL